MLKWLTADELLCAGSDGYHVSLVHKKGCGRTGEAAEFREAFPTSLMV